MTDPSKTIYGERSLAPRASWTSSRSSSVNGGQGQAPGFRTGRWSIIRSHGSVATSWMGWPSPTRRTGLTPDGTPALGISFRQARPSRGMWVVEFMNVSESFPAASASRHWICRRERRNVTVTSESPGIVVRERYLVPDDDNWVYRLDTSNDGGRSWNEGSIEFTFRRSK